jgi:hypothetical protein
MNETPQPEKHGVGRGVALGLGLNAVFALLWYGRVMYGLRGALPQLPSYRWLNTLLFQSLFWIGATQLIYILPAIAHYHRKQRPGVVKGLVIAATLVMLLNVICRVVLR